MLTFSTAVGVSAFALCAVAGAPAAQAAPSGQSAADAVVSLTNNERAKAGCPALKADPQLTEAAQAHTEDMAAGGFLDHNSSKGDPGDRIRAAGYRAQTWAENIAEGQRSPSEVVDAWMNSSGHRANILNCGLRDIGVGYAKSGNGTPYWTQDFGTSNRKGDADKPGGGKPSDDGAGKPKPGKPSDGGGDKPSGDGSPADPWGDGSDGAPDNGDNSPWDPWGDGSDSPSDNGGDSWDPWGEGSDNGDSSWDPWGDNTDSAPGGGGNWWDPWGASSWDPWGTADSGNGADSSWDPWSNGFDSPSNNGGDSSWDPWSNGFDAPVNDFFRQLVGQGRW
ncbi:CAP domain-containing protein [Nocardia brasiliensis]|uniref:CAP domain-containing protein n=1 Tax=Nocardia brasiliensis TaxID=37326 RepID=UPI00366C0E36